MKKTRPRGPKTLRIEGRRLEAIRISPVASAVGLGLIVVALVAWVVSALLVLSWLATVASLSGLVALALIAAHTWKRLLFKGRLLFGVPATLLAVGLVLAELEVPWAMVFGWAGAGGLLLALVLGVAPRGGTASTQVNLMRASVEPSLVRTEAPGEAMTLTLDDDGLELGEERWPLGMIAGARFEPRLRPVLRVKDRIGDEVAVEVDAASVEEAKELVARLSAGSSAPSDSRAQAPSASAGAKRPSKSR